MNTIGRWFISSDSSSPFMRRSRLRCLFVIDAEVSTKEAMSQEYCCFWSSFSNSNPSHCPSLPSIVIDDRNSIDAKAHLCFKMIANSMR